MKRLVYQLLVLIAVFANPIIANAYDFTAENSDGVTIGYNILSEDDLTCEVALTGYSSYKYEGNIRIPSTVNYNNIPFSVIAIGMSSFFGCRELTSIEIPNSVTSIGEKAFFGCTSLTSVDLPNSLTEIGEKAFFECSSLTTIVIPESLKYIGDKAFFGCKSLEEIEFNAIELGNFHENFTPFSNCETLNKIVFGEKVVKIPTYLCANCKELTTVEIPKSVTSIGNGAFYKCWKLKTIVIPENVTNIGWKSFLCGLETLYFNATNCTDYYCIFTENINEQNHNLKEVIFGDNVQVIPSNTFYNCIYLSSVKLPNSLISIGAGAFEKCNLSTIDLPNSLTSIGIAAFSGCKLTSVEIPTSVKSIGERAFNGNNIKSAVFGCSAELAMVIPRANLEEITLMGNIDKFTSYPFNESPYLYKLTVLGTEPPTITRAQFTEDQILSITLVVPDESIERYKKAKVWEYFPYIEGFSISNIVGIPYEKPVIEIAGNSLKIYSPEEDVTCRYSIYSDDMMIGYTHPNHLVPVKGEYVIKAYVEIDGKRKSETTTATLVWVNPSVYDPDNIISMQAEKAVLISSDGGRLRISGTELGERIELYTVDGKLLSTEMAADGETIIPCYFRNCEIVIVKYGDKSVKIKL